MAADVAAPLFAALALLFGAGGVLVLVDRWRHPRSRLWVVYATELPIVAAIVVPAYLGGAWWVAAVLAIGALTVREAAAVLHRIGGPAPLLAILYPAACLVVLARLGLRPNGFGLVVFLYGVVEVNDAFALLVGKLVGRRRLWPRLSPGKTLEGSLGGLAAGVGAALLLGFAVPAWGPAERAAAGLVVGLIGQAGDLAASAIKRAAGVKDYGALVPGSGGVLDVYDSLAFAAPFFYGLALLLPASAGQT